MKKLSALFVILLITCYACKKEDFFSTLSSVESRFEQSIAWNSHHAYREISVPLDDYTIFCMSDSHVGSTNNLDAFIDSCKTKNASAIVMVGDLTSGETSDFDLFQQHIPRQELLPSFFLIGNHDLYKDGWNQFFTRFGSSSYLFTVQTPSAKDLFICLDTGNGTLGNHQLNWLRAVFQSERPKCRHCIVFTHNNLFLVRHTESAALSIDELDLLIELFTVNKVDMEISGHDHQHDLSTMGNTKYIVMDALMDGFSNSGYLELKLKNGLFENRFINF